MFRQEHWVGSIQHFPLAFRQERMVIILTRKNITTSNKYKMLLLNKLCESIVQMQVCIVYTLPAERFLSSISTTVALWHTGHPATNPAGVSYPIPHPIGSNTICVYKIVQLYALRLCSIAALRDFFGLKYKCYWYNLSIGIKNVQQFSKQYKCSLSIKHLRVLNNRQI